MAKRKPQKRFNEKTLADLANDPLKFVKLCWPDMKLTDYQASILESVNTSIETFVHAANAVGKTRIAAITAIWFYFTRTPSRVMITSSTEAQLKNILWKEILMLVKSSVVKFPWESRRLEFRKIDSPEFEIEARDGMFGCATNSVESFQGYHLPTDCARELVIIDEASGVEDDIYEASRSWASRILAIGNPLRNDGFFAEKCRAGNVEDPANEIQYQRQVIHVSADDSPNVQLGKRLAAEGKENMVKPVVDGIITYERYLRSLHDFDESQRTIRLDGQFYEGKLSKLFPRECLDQAMDRKLWQAVNSSVRKPVAIGVDTAEGGKDKTCITLVDHHGIIEQHALSISDSMEIAGIILEMIRTRHLAPSAVVIDAGGGGKQIADRIREQGYNVTTEYFGAAANDSQAYVNRRAELYGILSDRICASPSESPFALPPDAKELRAELAVLPLSRDSEGRLKLLSKRSTSDNKESIQKLLGRSPDRADSLALAVSALESFRGNGPLPPGYVPSHAGKTKLKSNHKPLCRKLTKAEVMAYPDGYREKMSVLMDILYPGYWREDESDE